MSALSTFIVLWACISASRSVVCRGEVGPFFPTTGLEEEYGKGNFEAGLHIASLRPGERDNDAENKENSNHQPRDRHPGPLAGLVLPLGQRG